MEEPSMEQALSLSYVEGDMVKNRHQIELEKLYSKNQTIQRIRKEFLECKDIDFVAYLDSCRIDTDFGIDFLIQMALHKRTTLPIMVGILRHHFSGLAAASQMTADLILRCVEKDLADWNTGSKQLIVKFTISEDVQRDLDRYQYPLPMVVKPRRIQSNRDTGYFTTLNSVILRKNHHEDDVCLDHLNRVNQIKFVINHDVATMIKNRWRNLDKPKPNETNEDYLKRVKAFNKYDRTAHEVIRTITRYGNEFHLTHKYDKRGRVYCQGYHINYQGAPWNKAVIELADKEYVE